MGTTQSYFQLTEVEVQRYEQLGQQARAGQIGYWTIYGDLAHLLTTKYGAAPHDSAVLWLRGASEAEVIGSFSALIRTFTEIQYRHRHGADLPAGAMQAASNAVAISLLDDLFGRNSGWPRGQVPDIKRIAFTDARAVRALLSNRHPADASSLQALAHAAAGATANAHTSCDVWQTDLAAALGAGSAQHVSVLFGGADADGFGELIQRTLTRQTIH